MEDAEDNVERHPDRKKPSRPVVAAKQKGSSEYRENPDQVDPHPLRIEPGVEFGKVVKERDAAYGYEDPTNDGDGKWSLGHALLHSAALLIALGHIDDRPLHPVLDPVFKRGRHDFGLVDDACLDPRIFCFV